MNIILLILIFKGFESRGTEISNRLTAWHNLLEEIRPSGRLTSNLYEYLPKRENVSVIWTIFLCFDVFFHANYFKLKKKPITKVENGTKNLEHKTNKRKFAKQLNSDKNALDDGDTKEDNAIDRPKKRNGRKKIKNRQKKLQQRSDGFFCGAPSEC